MFKKTAGKFVYEMLVPKIKKSLPERRKHFEDVVKGTDKYTKSLTNEGKIAVKKNVSPTVSKISKIMDQKDNIRTRNKGSKKIFKAAENKAKGGRVGLKGGTNLGMQSVKYGLDNNPKITAADPKAKFIAAAKNKKKKFQSPMAKAVKKKNKKKII